MNPEIDNILDLMADESSNPSAQFKERLRNKINRKYTGGWLFTGIFPSSLAGASILTSFGFILIIAIVFLVVPGMSRSTVYVTTLKEDEKLAVVKNIIDANPSSVLPDSTLAEIQVEQNPLELKEEVDRVIDKQLLNNIEQPEAENNLYTFYNTVSKGSAIKQCSGLEKFLTRKEQLYYHDNNATDSYYRENIKSFDNKLLVKTTIGKYFNTGTDNLYYFGGVYAEMISSRWDDFPISYSTGNNYGNFSSFTVNQEAKEKNQEYFITEYTSYIDCDNGKFIFQPFHLRNNAITVKVESWIKKDDYKILRSHYYINEKSSNNLLYTEEYTYTYSNITPIERDKLFKLDESIPTRTSLLPNGYSVVEEAISEKTQALASRNIKLIRPVNNNSIEDISTLSYLSDYDYYWDKNFYASTPYGENEYNYAINSKFGKTIEANVYTIVNEPYQFSSFPNYSVHKKESLKEEVLANYFLQEEFSKVDEQEVIIDGENIPLEIFSSVRNNLEPLSSPVSYPEEYVGYVPKICLFKYNGNYYSFVWVEDYQREWKVMWY